MFNRAALLGIRAVSRGMRDVRDKQVVRSKRIIPLDAPFLYLVLSLTSWMIS
jgi:hypothetical protein